jgi:hypothetical protein
MVTTQEPLSDARIRTGLLLGLEIASRTLWDTAVRIKDDKEQGFSERLAIVKVLREIHDQIKAEMEKINGSNNTNP